MLFQNNVMRILKFLIFCLYYLTHSKKKIIKDRENEIFKIATSYLKVFGKIFQSYFTAKGLQKHTKYNLLTSKGRNPFILLCDIRWK